MIYIKSEKEIERMRRSNRAVMETLIKLGEMIEPGINIKSIEKRAEELAMEKGGIPAFKGYNGYPSSICISINEVIIHGIPHNRVLEEGDLVGLDYGILIDGFYGDAAITVPVGEVSKKVKKLLRVTEKALYEGISKARAGNRLGDISYSVQSFVERNGFSVIRDFTGHGIGRKLHEEPTIPNYGKPGTGIKIEKGMTFAIEPMVAAGSYEIEVLPDGWTAMTKDRSFSAHFEHTIAVTEGKPEILSVEGKEK